MGVTPYTGGSGCIIACSREAKSFGVKTGDRVSEARNKCPYIVILESRPDLYLFYHREIFSALSKFSPWITPLSIDEFKIILKGRDKSLAESLKIAKEIKFEINKKADYLKCSVGIGPNMFLAKVAAESKKPDGLTVCKLENLDDFYKKIKLRDMPGINFQMEKKLAECKIYTASDFYNSSFIFLRNILGHLGKAWHYRLRGFEVDGFQTKNKSVGHSHVLAPEMRSREMALSVLKKLAIKTAYRLRRENLWAGGVAVYISFMNGGKFYDFKKIGRASCRERV